MTDTIEKITFSVSEAAEALGVSKPVVYRLIETDGFPVLRIGKRTLISCAGLRRWVDERAGAGAVV